MTTTGRSRLIESADSPARIQAIMVVSAAVSEGTPASTLHFAGLDAVPAQPDGQIPSLVLTTWLKLRDIPAGDPINVPLAVTAVDPDGRPVFPSIDNPGVVVACNVELPARSVSRINLCFNVGLVAAVPASIPTRVTFRATLDDAEIGWTDLEILPAGHSVNTRVRVIEAPTGPTRR